MHSFTSALKYWIIFTSIAGIVYATAPYAQIELRPVPEWAGLLLAVLPIIGAFGFFKSRVRLVWLKRQHKALVQATTTCGLMTTTWLIASLISSQVDSEQLRQFLSYLSLSYLLAVMIFGTILVYALFVNHKE